MYLIWHSGVSAMANNGTPLHGCNKKNNNVLQLHPVPVNGYDYGWLMEIPAHPMGESSYCFGGVPYGTITDDPHIVLSG